MKKRVFVGVPMDESANRGVRRILKMLERKHWPVKWEPEEKWHMTMAWLGWIREEEVTKVASAVAKAMADKQAALTLRFKGLGGFPDLVYPRVIWLGLKAVGMKQRSEMGRQIKKLVNLDLAYEWRVDRVVVYESQMKRNGSKYIKIKEYGLL